MYYSLRQKKLNRENRNKSILYIGLTIVAAVAIFFVGVRVLVYIVNFVSDLKNSDSVVNSQDNIPPNIPIVSSYPDYTNKTNAEIKGEAEASSQVTLVLNGEASDQVSDADGTFIFKVILDEGENTFLLFATDSAGNESVHTKQYTIILDTQNPNLTISQPADNSTVYGNKNRLLEIKGNTDSDVTLTINDKFVLVNDDGSFVYKYNLQNGDNDINLVAKDKAGNEETKSIKVNFQE